MPLTNAERQAKHRKDRAATHSRLNLQVPMETKRQLEALAAAHGITQAEALALALPLALAAATAKPEEEAS